MSPDSRQGTVGLVRWFLVTVLVLTLCRPALSGTVEVVVVNLGWHTGIAVPIGALDRATMPEAADFKRSNVAWVEFGWGDASFYQTPDPDLGTVLKAAFAETPAVVQLVGVPVHPTAYYRDSTFVAVPLTSSQFDRLLRYLSDAFLRGGAERVTAINRGLYPDSLFYPATGSFTLSNTCNTWVAKAFAAAGLAIEDAGQVVRASTVMDRLLAAGAVRVPATE